MLSDSLYAPITLPNGKEIYGAAAYMHRVASVGGPTAFAEGYRNFVDAQLRQSYASSNVIPFVPRAA